MLYVLGFALVATLIGACSSSGSGTPATSSTSSSGAGGTGGASHASSGAGGGDAGPDAPVNMCSAAIAMVTMPVDKVSTGVVSVIGMSAGVTTLYVDASAGGFAGSNSFPRVYVDLATGTRVDITDKQALTSTAWDLAIKRPVLYTNDGDGGPGMGGTLILTKPFDQVTAADAKGTFATEHFVDAQCNPKMDPAGDILTTMSNWYNYDQQTNVLTPMPGTTYILRGGAGKLYKMAILSYYGEPDGGMGTLGAYYILQVGAL
jgi:hypothetical protein